MLDFLKAITFLGIVFTYFSLNAQQDTRKQFKYFIKKSASNIIIDGIEHDGEWNNSQLIDTLYNHYPLDTGIGKHASEIRLTYDNESLYIFAKHFDEGERIIQSLQRDSDDSQWGSDSFAIVIDPINKKQSGIFIGVNAGGAETDGSLQILPNRTIYRDTFDERWFSSTKQYDNYWITEIAIPFTSLRYNQDNLEWGINFIRGDKVESSYYTWTLFPVNFNAIDVNYMGSLVWPEVPEVEKNIAFVKPYSTVSSLKDNLNSLNETTIDAGIDVKFGITKSLYADITVNPDFSNADVDQEITNITRFDIRLPEQREFFLENADIFSSFGSGSVNPFFSRRIGLSNPIQYGARVTGNINDNLRIGAMNVLTKEDQSDQTENNTVLAFNQKVSSRSQFKGIFINRQSAGSESDHDYNRNFGTEFTYISEKGNFTGSAKYLGSVSSSGQNGTYFGFGSEYANRVVTAGVNIDIINSDFQADLGFIPRLFNYDAKEDRVIKKGYTELNPFFVYRFWPKEDDSKLNLKEISLGNNTFLNEDGSLNESNSRLSYNLSFKNTARLSFEVNHRKVNLPFETNFLGDSFDNLPIDNYNFAQGSIRYNSDTRKKITYDFSVSNGSFYNGKISSFSSGANLRLGYWANFSLNYNYNNINLPENYGDVALHLFRFRGLLSFTNKLFLNNVVQYNTQSENFSIFSRLQWRYSPLSDIFLIYNQNNDTGDFDLKNQSIILKVTYRFAI